MEDTNQYDWSTEYDERLRDAEEYSAYMTALAKDQERLRLELQVLRGLVNEKTIQLRKVESYLL